MKNYFTGTGGTLNKCRGVGPDLITTKHVSIIRNLFRDFCVNCIIKKAGHIDQCLP